MTAEAARAAVAAEAAAAAHVQNKSIDQELVATHPGTDLMSASKYLKHFVTLNIQLKVNRKKSDCLESERQIVMML